MNNREGQENNVRLLVLLAGLAVSLGACQKVTYDFDRPALVVAEGKLSHPTDIVRFKGQYVVAELFNNRLAIFSDLQLSGLRYFDPKQIGKQFQAPHFLAVTRNDTLLISNGWGNSIVAISDLDGRDWREFSGTGGNFNAPHGICVDEDGWIYVGDSLNSRLVRFRDMNGKDWQVFADLDKRVSYIRQLVCRDGAVWASNSYENRPGLHSGEGGNVLKIQDFASGRADVVYSFPLSNLTGVMPLNDNKLLVGLWSVRRQLVLHDMRADKSTLFNRIELGTPYGIFVDGSAGQVLVAHIGQINEKRAPNLGGIAIYRP